jgi:hypothetical protein
LEIQGRIGWKDGIGKLAARVSDMVHSGILEVCGERRGLHNLHVPLYRVAERPDGRPAVQRRMARFLKRLDKLDARRAISSCMASRVSDHAAVLRSERDRQIVERRLAGEELVSIAAHFGLSRERASQIFNCAVLGRTRRGRIPVALRQRLLPLPKRGPTAIPDWLIDDIKGQRLVASVCRLIGVKRHVLDAWLQQGRCPANRLDELLSAFRSCRPWMRQA